MEAHRIGNSFCALATLPPLQSSSTGDVQGQGGAIVEGFQSDGGRCGGFCCAAFCYAELSSRCSSAGSAYHYSYICVGEGVAWLIGWALILEYTIAGSGVARGISLNLALLFGGADSLPAFMARHYIPWKGRRERL